MSPRGVGAPGHDPGCPRTEFIRTVGLGQVGGDECEVAGQYAVEEAAVAATSAAATTSIVFLVCWYAFKPFSLPHGHTCVQRLIVYISLSTIRSKNAANEAPNKNRPVFIHTTSSLHTTVLISTERL